MELKEVQEKLATKKKRQAQIAIAAFAITLAITAGLFWSNSQEEVNASNLEVGLVKQGRFDIKLVVNGQFESRRSKLITASQPGVIEKVFISPGEQIKKGDALFQLYNDDTMVHYEKAKSQYEKSKLELELKEARLNLDKIKQEAEVSQFKGNLNVLEARFKAQQTLSKTGIISKLDLLSTQVEVENAKASFALSQQSLATLSQLIEKEIFLAKSHVQQAERELSAAQKNIEQLTIIAPEAGQVQEINVRLGEQIDTGTVVSLLAQQGDLRFVAQVPERQAQQISINNPVQIWVFSEWLNGAVEGISPQVNNGYIDIFVRLDTSHPQLKQALSAKAEIITEQLPDTLYAQRPSSGEPLSDSTVWVIDEQRSKLIKQAVTFGRVSQNNIQIVSGLHAGQKILISPPSPYWQSPELTIVQ